MTSPARPLRPLRPPPLPPPRLSDEARAVWERLAPHTAPGSLTAGTADLFAMLCTQVATWHEADQLVSEAGILTASGAELGVNPALAVRDHADQMTMRWAKAFGLMPGTPAPAPPGRPGALRHLREA